MSKKSWAAAMIIPLTAVAVVSTAPAASAKGGGEVRAAGACSSTTHWNMKAKPDNGRLELELEIDSNRNGQSWAVRITDNSVLRFAGNRVTAAPSGSFEVRLLTANLAGVDHFVGTARNARTGETCTARVNV